MVQLSIRAKAKQRMDDLTGICPKNTRFPCLSSDCQLPNVRLPNVNVKIVTAGLWLGIELTSKLVIKRPYSIRLEVDEFVGFIKLFYSIMPIQLGPSIKTSFIGVYFLQISVIEIPGREHFPAFQL